MQERSGILRMLFPYAPSFSYNPHCGFLSLQPLGPFIHQNPWCRYTGDNAAGNNTDPEGMEWVGWGMYRVNTHTQDFIKDAVAGSKGPADCLNGNDNWPWPATSLKRRDQGEKEQ